MTETALQPINPSTLSDAEKEDEAPWVVRKLVGSLPGRVVLSSYETLKATSTSVICLSPWGDSSPLLLPCIRFRDLVIHTVIAATGGTAAIAAPIAHTAVATFGDTIAVEIGKIVVDDVGAKVANDLIGDKAAKVLLSAHSARLETTSVKTILITLKFKHTMTDAALGFFRSGSVHKDSDLFTNLKDYLSVEKGWFSPYLFASSRRPVIPRSMKPDIIFCHGPFLSGDYRIAETLLIESTSVIKLCADPPPAPASLEPQQSSHNHSDDVATAPASPPKSSMLKASEMASELSHKISSYWHSTPSPSPPTDGKPVPEPSMNGKGVVATTTELDPPVPSSAPPVALSPTPTLTLRRILVVVLGISPHRRLWTTSARPGESVMNYHLLNGCPALVIPALSANGSTPLVAWDTLTLEHLHTIGREKGGIDGDPFKGVVTCLFEYLSLCIDWDRVTIPEELGKHTEGTRTSDELKKQVVRDGLKLVLAGAVRSHDSEAVKADVDTDRAGIVMFRLP